MYIRHNNKRTYQTRLVILAQAGVLGRFQLSSFSIESHPTCLDFPVKYDMNCVDFVFW
jgi:hypothetical protein